MCNRASPILTAALANVDAGSGSVPVDRYIVAVTLMFTADLLGIELVELNDE